MVSTIVGAIINFGLNFFLIPQYGGMGAAIATAFSYFVIMVIRMVDVCRFINIKIDFTRFWIQFLTLFIAVLFSCRKSNISLLIPIFMFVIILISDMWLLKKITVVLKRLINR